MAGRSITVGCCNVLNKRSFHFLCWAEFCCSVHCLTGVVCRTTQGCVVWDEELVIAAEVHAPCRGIVFVF